jgi:hypothetical protein
MDKAHQQIGSEGGLGVYPNKGALGVTDVQQADMEKNAKPHHEAAKVVECVKAWVVVMHGNSGLDIYH